MYGWNFVNSLSADAGTPSRLTIVLARAKAQSRPYSQVRPVDFVKVGLVDGFGFWEEKIYVARGVVQEFEAEKPLKCIFFCLSNVA